MFQFHDVDNGARAEKWHDHPEVGVVHEGHVVPAEVLVQTRRHYVDFLSDVCQITVLKMFQVHNLNRNVLLVIRRCSVNVLRFPDEAERSLTNRAF